MREGLKLAVVRLGAGKTLNITEAETLAAAVAAWHAAPSPGATPPFDLVLLDLHMPDSAGLAGLRAFRQHCPGARIMVISAAHDIATVRAALEAGVQGFVSKLSGADTLLGALRFVLAGGTYLPQEMLMDAAPHSAPATPATPAGLLADMALTARQVEVLRHLLAGESNKQICREMDLAVGTVKGHVAAILKTLDVHSRAAAIAAVERRGWRARLEGGFNPAS